MSRRRVLRPTGGLAALLAAACLSACGMVSPGGPPSTLGETPTLHTPSPSTSASASPTGPALPSSTWALTGLTGGGAGAAVVVPVLLAAGQPRAIGLDSADLVSLDFAEAGGFRAVAVFQSDTSREVGPLTMVRVSDAKLFSPLGPAFTETGTPEGFGAVFHTSHLSLQSFKAGVAGFGSSGGHAYVIPNKLSTRGLIGPPALFTYGPTGGLVVPSGASTAATVAIGTAGHATVTWHFDAAAKLWRATILGTAVSAANLIIMKVPYEKKSVHALHADVMLADPLGSGAAWVYSGTSGTTGTWSKKNFTAGLILQCSNTTPTLTPGRTWIIEVPSSGTTVTAS
jgi:hypothetical protein